MKINVSACSCYEFRSGGFFKKGGEGEIHRYFCMQLIDNVTISHNIR